MRVKTSFFIILTTEEFIDLDEFIVPIQDKTIPQFLYRFEDASAIEVNWLVYGSGGARKKVAGGVMERFERHS